MADLWDLRAHAAQRPPPGPWRAWVFLGGRGAGKTWAGAQWVRRAALDGGCGRIALIAPTLHDAREVMVEGPSGLVAIGGADSPAYEASRRRLVWPNGAIAQIFSAEDPDSLRGPQFHAAWADEWCAWADPQGALDLLRPALRLGADPRLVITTTPRPLPALKALLSQPGVVLTRAGTAANAMNLAPGFLEGLHALWDATPYARQELEGEIVEAFADALWTRPLIAQARAAERPNPDEIVVAVDPPASMGAGADACGIVAAGAAGEGRERRAVVMADASVQGLSPQGWAARAAGLARDFCANAIVAEANNGGEMVRTVLALAAPDIPVRLVRAAHAKRARAEPIAALYEQGRIAHAGAFPALEDEMCAFGAACFRGSPDRVDALVWALSALMLTRADPRLRAL